MIGQIFLSLQVKQSVILVINWYIQVDSQVAKKLRTYNIRNLGNIRENSKFNNITASTYSSSQNEQFFNTSKNLLKNRNWTFPIVCYFTWKLEFGSNIWRIIVSRMRFLLLTCPRSFRIWLVWQLKLEQLIKKKCWDLSYLIITLLIFSLRSKFGIVSHSSLVQDFSKDKTNCSQNMTFVIN